MSDHDKKCEVILWKSNLWNACWCHERALEAENATLKEQLAEALPIVRDLTRQITEFTEREGEADFYTGVATEFLKKQSPCNHVWAKRLRGRDTCAVCGVVRAADSAAPEQKP